MKKVHINMCPILDGYGVMTVFQFPYMHSCEPRLTAYLDTWEECGVRWGGLVLITECDLPHD